MAPFVRSSICFVWADKSRTVVHPNFSLGGNISFMHLTDITVFGWKGQRQGQTDSLNFRIDDALLLMRSLQQQQ